MDNKALYDLTSGLFVLGTLDGNRSVGCVVNTVIQTTAQPVTITFAVNKKNYTQACLKRYGNVAVSILSQDIDPEIIRIFGFSSSKDRNKFDEVPSQKTNIGLPYLKNGVTGYLQAKVIQTLDVHTHTVFVAELFDAVKLSEETALSYGYYHSVIKGKTPPTASGYIAEQPTASEAAYVCGVCGYRYPGRAAEFAALGEDYVCPICGAAKKLFVLTDK